MKLIKAECKDADDKNCILVVETNGSELTIKKDRWHPKVREALISSITQDFDVEIKTEAGENAQVPSYFFDRSLKAKIQRLLGAGFTYFSISKKTPKNSPFLFILSVAFDTSLKGYESRVSVKDIEVPLKENIESSIEAIKKRIGEMDAVKDAEAIPDKIVSISVLEIYLDIIEAFAQLEECIADNWSEISEAEHDRQAKLWG